LFTFPVHSAAEQRWSKWAGAADFSSFHNFTSGFVSYSCIQFFFLPPLPRSFPSLSPEVRRRYKFLKKEKPTLAFNAMFNRIDFFM
jgi:hypothetical protein